MRDLSAASLMGVAKIYTPSYSAELDCFCFWHYSILGYNFETGLLGTRLQFREHAATHRVQKFRSWGGVVRCRNSVDTANLIRQFDQIGYRFLC